MAKEKRLCYIFSHVSVNSAFYPATNNVFSLPISGNSKRFKKILEK